MLGTRDRDKKSVHDLTGSEKGPTLSNMRFSDIGLGCHPIFYFLFKPPFTKGISYREAEFSLPFPICKIEMY